MASRVTTQRYRVAEWSLRSATTYPDPANDVQVDAVVTTPSGRGLRVPAYYAGNHVWRVRYSSSERGTHRWRTECSDPADAGLHGAEGTVEVAEYDGDNPLYRHGSIRVSEDHTYLTHADGKPFFWLGDTCWMGLTRRLRWPEEFQRTYRAR